MFKTQLAPNFAAAIAGARASCKLSALVVLAMALASCWPFYPTHTYRFRMTVEAQTPQGPRSASSVMQVNAQRQPKVLPEAHSASVEFKGEAVVLDLPSGPVFVLLAPKQSGDRSVDEMVTNAFTGGRAYGGAVKFVPAVRSLEEAGTGVKADLPRADWPMMVRFGDINDPTSVVRVDPDAVGIKRIVLETTNAPVTTGIEKRLRWLKAAEEFVYHGTDYGDFFPYPSGYFRSGMK